MSFKTMDGVEVYDKHEVDTAIATVQQAAANAKQTAESIESRKLNTSDATLEFAADRTRLSALEEGKADKSEISNDFSADRTRLTDLENNKADKSALASLVSSAIDSVINSKMSLIESDINHIVDNVIDNAVDHKLEDYDNSSTVDNKIATAIGSIPTMTTAEATALIDNYF